MIQKRAGDFLRMRLNLVDGSEGKIVRAHLSVLDGSDYAIPYVNLSDFGGGLYGENAIVMPPIDQLDVRFFVYIDDTYTITDPNYTVAFDSYELELDSNELVAAQSTARVELFGLIGEAELCGMVAESQLSASIEPVPELSAFLSDELVAVIEPLAQLAGSFTSGTLGAQIRE